MSVAQNPLTGRMRQKLGGIVFSTWKGINVVKGKPLTVANPKSDKQLMRRSALTQMVEIFRVIVAAVDLGFKEQAVHKSSYNAFTGYNLKNAFDYSAPPAATLQIHDVLVAQGTISPTPISTAALVYSTGVLTLTWPTSATDPGQSANDVAIAVVYDGIKDTWVAVTSSTARSAGTGTFNCGATFADHLDDCTAFLFFYNATSRKASTSTYKDFAAS